MDTTTGNVAIDDSGTQGGRELRGDLVCGLCTRTAARVEGTWGARFVPRKLWVRDAEHGEMVRRMRCPHCGGHLALHDPEVLAPPRTPHPDEYRRGPLPGGRPRRLAPHTG